MSSSPSCRRRRRSIMREFCLNTTAHGLPGIVRSESTVDCLFWLLVSIGFFGAMIFFLTKAIIAYLEYPTSIDASIVSEWPQYFPAISICNISPLRLDKFWQPFLNFSIANNLSMNGQALSSEIQLQNIAHFIVSSWNKNESMSPYFFSLSSMLMDCSFNNIPCDVNDFVPFLSSFYGACYTFNAKLKNSTKKSILYANEYGGEGLLNLRLYIHAHQYIPYLLDGFGAVVLIHDNTQVPLIEALGIELTPGQRHKLGYRKKTSYFLSKPYTKCTNKISYSMQAMFDNYNEADYSYSETVCYQLCSQVYAYEKCGCVNPRLWNARQLYIPSLDRVIFAPLCESLDRCFTQVVGELLTSPTLLEDRCSDCTQECIIKQFPVQSSSISTPAEWQMEDIKRFVENSSIPLPTGWNTSWRQHIQQSYLTINIVRETSIVENNTQSATISPVDLLSNIGGQTGLWIGISLLSVMELIDIIYRLIQNELRIREEKKANIPEYSLRL